MTELTLIHEKINDHFNVEYMYLFKRNTNRRNTYIRQLFHYLSQRLNGYDVSLNEIGHYCSDISKPFNHASVLYSIRRIEGFLIYDKSVRNDIIGIIKLLPKTHKIEKEINYLNGLKD